MAKKLEQVPEDQIEKRTGGVGRKPKYPWSDWLDGDLWQLESGVDFEPSDFKSAETEEEAREAFLRNARSAANKQGLGLYARLMKDGKSVLIRAQEKRQVAKKGEGKHSKVQSEENGSKNPDASDNQGQESDDTPTRRSRKAGASR